MIWITLALNSAPNRLRQADVVKGATEFTMSVIRNRQRQTNYRYIPKLFLDKLGNPDHLKFVFRGDDILVVRPD